MSSAVHDLIPLSDERAWNDALVDVPHAYAHTHEHAAALAADGGPPSVLYCGDFDGTRVICPLRFRGPRTRDWYSPYGFAGFASQATVPSLVARWREFARSAGAVSAYIVQHPGLPLPFNEVETTHDTARTLYLVELRGPAEDLRGGFSQTIRNKLNRWDRAGLELEDDRDALVRAFIDLYPQTMRRTGAGGAYDFHETTLRAWASGDQTLLFGVRGERGIEAVTLFGYAGGCADYLFNVATESGRDYTTGLLWQAFLALRVRGIATVNLGGGIRENDGLARYKARIANTSSAMSVQRMVCDSVRFRQLCRAAETPFPPVAQNYFPPYHVAGESAALRD